MDYHIVKSSLHLGRGSLVRIEDGRDMVLIVRRGALWLTLPGDPRDRYLHSGDWFTIASNGLALLQALRASSISLVSPHAKRFAKRIDVVRASTGAVEPVFAPQPALAWS
jgi:hypothetical protein